jgi:hypothetical protein
VSLGTTLPCSGRAPTVCPHESTIHDFHSSTGTARAAEGTVRRRLHRYSGGKVNREFVLFHLREVAEDLSRTVREIESNPEYDSGEFLVAAQHAYHHLNSAWNGQDLHELQVANVNDSRWSRLGRFPEPFPLMSLE